MFYNYVELFLIWSSKLFKSNIINTLLSWFYEAESYCILL